jgi:N-acetylglutamate synthase-like GNAT family acetyltransferase
LLQIGKHYQENGGQFWLARVDGKVVGSIALIALENGRAALKKMFVAKDYRKTGLGRQLVNTLVDFCKEEGIEEVYLGTTQRFVSAQQYGFEKILKGSLPNDFPLLDVDDTFYVYKLR